MIKCLVCNQNKWQKHLNKLVKCTNCGFVRAHDRYFKIDPVKLYSQSYFRASDYGDYQLEQKALEKNFQDRLRRIRRFKKNGQLLEIGCAYGYFLKLAKQHYRACGIDLDPQVTKLARKNSGTTIYTGDFLTIKLPPNHFDVVCLFDTIEHLKNPDLYLEKIWQILAPKGLVVIETGDIESLLAKIQGASWRLITPPFHLQYFSRKSLTRLLEKYGFKVVRIDRVSFYRTIRQILYKLTHNQKLISLDSPLLSKSFPLNTYDLLLLIAQKPNAGRQNFNTNRIIQTA